MPDGDFILLISFYIYWLEFFCREELPLIYFFSNLFILVLSHRYLFYSMVYNIFNAVIILLLRFSRCGLQVGSLSFQYAPLVFSLGKYFFSGMITLSRFILYFSAETLESVTCPRSSGSFYWRWYLETKFWMWCVLIASEVPLLLLGPLSRQS